MDPDIPAPSIERDDLPDTNSFGDTSTIIVNTTTSAAPGLASPAIQVKHYDPIHFDSAASVPLPPSSPMRTPYRANKTKSVSPKPPSRSPSSASSYRGDRQSTPSLVTARSTSSLSTTRGGTPQYRRASSNLNPSSPATNGKMAFATLPERPPVTASSVAREYFAAELEAHTPLQSPLVVIVHDSCYGHRFSRPRSTKNTLATIVERPERVLATLLGASTAYVRLGGRHAEGEHAPRPKHNSSQVRGIPFQIRKTSRIIPLSHPSVTFVHGAKWMEELQIMCDTAEGKLALNGKELVRPVGYGKDEEGKPLPKLHEGDLYLCAESLAALQGCLGGVCDAVDMVFSSNPTTRAFVCIRPPGHHCSSNFPSGFCWLNNVHVGITYAATNHGLTHAAIIDFDLHHGDGSQNIAWDHNRRAQSAPKNAAAHKKTPIGYYSLHDINSYPCEWGDEEKVRNASLCIENAHGQSIWNVHLEPWKTLEEFWKLYETKYTVILDKARNFLRHHTAKLRSSGNQQPKAAIFISAGFDASEWEGAGMQRHSVNVPTDFYARFTADIVKLAHEDDLGVDGRVISVLEGGYSDRALTSGSFSHICGLAGDSAVASTENGSTFDPNRFQTINQWTPENVPFPVNGQTASYTSEWWAAHNLEELEAVVAGRQPSVSKSSRDKTATYSSPTQASTLKMTKHAQERHSLSALQARLSLDSEYEPPPPDVEWAIASYELSRIIIPGDRQTLSCTHDELNAEATKARRERQSTLGVPVAPDERMQLRDRRAKVQSSALGTEKTPSRNDNRRTTIAAISDLPDSTMHQYENMPVRPRRRSSDASSILSSFQNMKLEENGGAPKMPSNPTSAAPSRASSTVPDKSTKPVLVKKTRAPPVPRVPGKYKTSPRKSKAGSPAKLDVQTVANPQPHGIPSNGNTENSTERRETSMSSQDGSNGVPNMNGVGDNSDGTKKISIKLKLPTAEDPTGKQHLRGPEDKQKKPRMPKRPVVPKNTKVVKPTPSASHDIFAPIQSKPAQIEEQSSFHPGLPRADNALSGTRDVVVPEEAYPGGSVEVITEGQGSGIQQFEHALPETTTAPPNGATHEEDVSMPDADTIFVTASAGRSLGGFILHMDELPTAVERPQSSHFQVPQAGFEHSTARPPSAARSTPVRRTKEDLPLFTSQSPIPFAAPPNFTINSAPKQVNGFPQHPSIWDVPETPKQK